MLINFQLDEMDAYRLIEYLKLAKRPLMSVSAKNSIDDIRETIECQTKEGIVENFFNRDHYESIECYLDPTLNVKEEPLQVNF